MKLLITTQTVDQNDPTLGFFHEWITAFAHACEHVEVICLYEGAHTLPSNVTVHSLGKDKKRLSTFIYAFRFLKISWALRKKYDTVFVHMNPEYVLVSGWWWRLSGKKIGLWYLHKSVTLRLKIAEIFVNVIFTASRESFRLPSKKVRIVGHGIPVGEFSRVRHESERSELRILSAGRIAPAKRVIEMLQALDVLHERGIPFTFTLAGGPGTPDDERYLGFVKEQIAAKPYAAQIHFLGPVAHEKIPELLAHADVFINLSTTGSMDKAVLEPFAAGVPVVSSNEAFREVLEPWGLYVGQKNLDIQKVADALLHAREVDTQPFIEYVKEEHSLEKLIPKILALLT